MSDELVEKSGGTNGAYNGAFTQVANVPMPSKEEGQRSINITDLFITRWTPPWSRPPSLPAYTWRAWVLNQPVAEACREVLLSLLLGLDWNISVRDTNQKEDLLPTVRYYMKLLSNGGFYLGTDFSGLLEWVVGDLLDIPFGGSVEIGRKNDSPNGRVAWLRPLDGGTMYPTLNHDFPAVQYYQGYTAVAFPSYSIARIYQTPRPEIFREGWGIAPPEKIYFALDMLNRGDKYYANLLLDIPPAGILDLGDMEKTSAQEWVDQFRTFVAGTTDAFKIPVLYEHNNDVKFIPFGKNPNDIMYDHISLKYAALVCAAYGLSLNDIGLQTSARGGETLAGSIRATNQTRRTGIARLKTKVKSFIEKILPQSLQFDWIDYDDEHNVAMGRARLASATALNLMASSGALSAEEFRMQMLADGLIGISIPDKAPPDALPASNNAPKNPGALGHGVPPSMGGEGEIKSLITKSSKAAESRLHNAVQNISYAVVPEILELMSVIGDDDLRMYQSVNPNYSNLDEIVGDKPILSYDLRSTVDEATKFHEINLDEKKKKEVSEKLKQGINGLLAKSIADEIANLLYTERVKELDNFEFDWDEEPDEVAVADTSNVNYDYIVDEIKSRILKSFPATLGKWIYKEVGLQGAKQ